MAEGRPSLYSRVPVKTSALFTDYKSRVLSHLSPNWTSSKKRDAGKIFEPLRNSIYVKSFATPFTSSTSTSQRSTIRKASRVLVTSAEKSQRLSASVNSSKQKKVSSLLRDPVKKVLSFDNDEGRVDRTVHKLQQLEHKEHQLQKEITNMEIKKGERKRKRINCQSETPCRATPNHTIKQQQLPDKAWQTKSGLSIDKQEHVTANNQRNPLEPLGKEEIVKRSINFSPDSDSDTDTNTVDKHHQYPLSPLAKDTNCKIINMTTVTHGIKSRVQQTLAKQVRKFSEHRQHSSGLSQQKVTPRCADRGRDVKKTKIRKDSQSVNTNTTRRDLWSPSRGRVEKTIRRPLKYNKDRGGLTNCQKTSHIKESRPQFISTISKSYKTPQKTAEHSVRKISTKQQRSLVDKENVAPRVVKPPSSPVVIRYTDDDPLLRDVFNTSIEALNQSLADVTTQFDVLENEAQSVLGSSEDIDKENILQQLAHIKKKQEELIRMEKNLQQQLKRESYYSAKKSQHAANRTKLGNTESGSGTVQRSLFSENTKCDLNIPEITEKAAKLEIGSNDMTNKKHYATDKLHKTDKVQSSHVDCTNLVLPDPVGTAPQRAILSDQMKQASSVLSSGNFAEQQDKTVSEMCVKHSFDLMLEQNSPIDLSNNAQKLATIMTSVDVPCQQECAAVDYSKTKDSYGFISQKKQLNVEDKAVVPGTEVADFVQEDVKSFSRFIMPLKAAVSGATGQSCVEATLSTDPVLLQLNDDGADNEVTLVMAKAHCGLDTSTSGRIQRCNNPLASLLEFGDDMHFVPVQEESNNNYVLQQASRIISCV